MNDGVTKLKKQRRGVSPNFLSGTSGSATTSRGRSIRLPTFIDYNSNTNANGLFDDNDDKNVKYRHRVKNRLIKYANSDSTSGIGALLRSAIRAGVLERAFWKRATVIVAFCALGLLLLLWRSYETHIELAFYPRSWIRKTILPVPYLSSTCFSPTSATMQSYNTTLANSPSHLILNPGISMRLGMDCYSFSASLPSTPLDGQTLPEEIVYHLYWRADLQPLGERQILLIKSILISQDARRSRVVLWTNSPDRILQDARLAEVLQYSSKAHIQALQDAGETSATVLPRFSVEHVDLPILAKGTAMEGHKLLGKAMDKKAWIDGDLVRVLVLYNYGGVWVDMDTVVLRDLRPLTEQEFVTQWDCYDKLYSPLNGAIMHFYKSSPYLCEMLHIMANDDPPRQGTTDWGAILYHKLHRRLLSSHKKPFSVLPYCLTDGRSCRLDNRLPDPFAKDDGWTRSAKGKEELQYKVDSIFSIHLHNQWSKMWPKGGWLDRLVIQPIESRWNEVLRGAV